jgi:hypothetical protein
MNRPGDAGITFTSGAGASHNGADFASVLAAKTGDASDSETGFGTHGAAPTAGAGMHERRTTLSASNGNVSCTISGGESGAKDSRSDVRGTASRAKRGMRPGMASLFALGSIVLGCPKRRNALPSPGAALRADFSGVGMGKGAGAASPGTFATLSGPLEKSTHWMSRQSTRSAGATTASGNCPRCVSASGSHRGAPDDMQRGAAAPYPLPRLIVSRMISGLLGERVESGMTVGFRPSARLFKSLQAGDASRSARGAAPRRPATDARRPTKDT